MKYLYIWLSCPRATKSSPLGSLLLPSISFKWNEIFNNNVFRQTNIWKQTFAPSIQNSMKVFGYSDYNAFCQNKTETRFEWTRRYICPMDWLYQNFVIQWQKTASNALPVSIRMINTNHLTGKLFYNRFYSGRMNT